MVKILPIAAGGDKQPPEIAAEPLVSIIPAEPVAGEQPLNIIINRPPEDVLREAHEAALALQKVIEAKPNKVVINGKTYLTFEDWQTVGRFYGLTVKVVDTKPFSFMGANGFEARAVVLDRTGLEVSGADGMCLDNEKRWQSADWQAIRSMAQTRACSKAFRNVLAFVPVLAGYAPTPAEEMDK